MGMFFLLAFKASTRQAGLVSTTPSYCVYIIQSQALTDRYYIGFIENIKPWDKAIAFEKYLKSPSGRAFAKKRL
jgi:hypothetical protein